MGPDNPASQLDIIRSELGAFVNRGVRRIVLFGSSTEISKLSNEEVAMVTRIPMKYSIYPLVCPRTDVVSRSTHMRYRALVAIAVLSAGCLLCTGQRALATDQKAAQIAIPVLLDTGLDSKKRTTGDEVEAKTAAPVQLADGTVIRRGAKVFGHITESKARSRGDTESSMAIVFDSITAEGKTINIKGSLRAVAPNPNVDSGGGVDYGSSLNRTMEHAGPTEVSTPAIPILDAQSEGVHGIKDLVLGADGVLRSQAKSVKVDHGAQMMLRVQVAPAN